jgi:hypothetical protein
MRQRLSYSASGYVVAVVVVVVVVKGRVVLAETMKAYVGLGE